MSKYMSENGLLNTNHHAYCDKKSTVTALTEFTDKCSDYLENGHQVAGIMINLSTAFDTIDKVILNRKLCIYGMDITVRKWMESYLSNRSQTVNIDGKN